MDSIFNYLKDFCIVYINDILVFSKTKEDNKKHIKFIRNIFKQYGIILSPKKIEIEKEYIEFLGIILNMDDIQLKNHSISKLRNFLKR